MQEFPTQDMLYTWYGIWIIGGIAMICSLIYTVIDSRRVAKQEAEDEKTLARIRELIIERCELAKKQYACMQEGLAVMKTACELQIGLLTRSTQFAGESDNDAPTLKYWAPLAYLLPPVGDDYPRNLLK